MSTTRKGCPDGDDQKSDKKSHQSEPKSLKTAEVPADGRIRHDKPRSDRAPNLAPDRNKAVADQPGVPKQAKGKALKVKPREDKQQDASEKILQAIASLEKRVKQNSDMINCWSNPDGDFDENVHNELDYDEEEWEDQYEHDFPYPDNADEEYYTGPPPAKRPKLLSPGDSVIDTTSESVTKEPEEDSNMSKPTSKFRQALQKYQKSKEKLGPPVSEDVSELVQERFRHGVDINLYKDTVEKYKKPENCTALSPVRVNDLIWYLLYDDTQAFDEKLQTLQTTLAKSGMAFAYTMDMIQSPHRLSKMEEIIDAGIDGLTLLGHAYHLLCLRRKELMKYDLDSHYGLLCSANIPHTSNLFGDDIEGEIRKITDTNKAAHTLRGANRYNRHFSRRGRVRGRGGDFSRGRGRGFSRFHRGGAGRARGAFRGRGRARGGRTRRPNAYQSKLNQGEVSMYEPHTSGHDIPNFNVDNDIHPADNDAMKVTKSFDIENQANTRERTGFEAGQLKKHEKQWAEITADNEILQTITGCTIEFEGNEIPIQSCESRRMYHNRQEEEIIDNEILQLKEKMVIEEAVHEPGEFLSHIFLRKKKNGKYRMILNLKEFNQYVQYHKFKMETFETTLKLISKGCYMASVDIRDAYYCVPVHIEFRKYLRFEWREKLYQFTCFPNGLSCAPRKYTKMMKPVYATLRLGGHTIAGYIDDSLLIADTEHDLLHTIQATLEMMEKLGFVINYDKSVLTPSTSITYLGFCIDSNLMRVTLNEEKVAMITQECQKLLAKNKETIRNVSRIIGLIVASFPAVSVGPLHYRKLEKQKAEALKQNYGNYEALMEISWDMKTELQWWADNLHCQYREIAHKNHEVTMTTDASNAGWGATLGKENTGGRWSVAEQEHHINYQELLAVKLALQSFEEKVTGVHVQVLTDNTTVVSYINNMGGRQTELNDLSSEIWHWILDKNSWVSANHIPGIENTGADFASRNFNDRTEWSLNKQVFQAIEIEFGEMGIDLFASRLNAKCKQYVSWHRDPNAAYVDAFSRNWSDTYTYIFPPFSLIGRCLQKLQEDQATAVIVAPFWPTQSWFTKLTSMMVQDPVTLPRNEKLLTLPGSEMLHPLRKKLRLIAAKVSGKPSESKAYLEKQSQSCCQPGNQALIANTPRTSDDGITFVYKKRLIKCSPLCLQYLAS